MAYHGGTLKSTSINGCQVYSLTGQHRSLATWLNPKKLRALRKDQDFMRRVEIIQDLRFETATTKIKATPDGEFLIASGIYPPQIKVYELRELALKFERHLDSEIVDFQVLADDYSKLAILCADRSVCLHAKYGSHYSLRIPSLLGYEKEPKGKFLFATFVAQMGRDMAYDCWSCDLLCAASSPDLYRINLAQGQFLSPLNTQSPALNVVCRSKLHGLVACGGEDGAVECFDMRTRSSVGRINAVGAGDQEVTAVGFDDDGGLQMAVGSSEGKVLIYDLRSSSPLHVKDHMYGSPILDISWHRTINSDQPKLITTDNHIVRIWDPRTGEGMTSIEPTAGAINDTCVFPESGLMLLALDSSLIPSYFIPALGPAPKWCSYLENLTEEMEENAQTTIYEDYKFVTKEELERLNLTNLIGTNLLRAYMHGFFIDYRLYKKAKEAVDPFVYDTYIEQKKKEQMDKRAASHITIKNKRIKVNRRLAADLLAQDEGDNKVDAATEKKPKKKKGLKKDIMEDPRFSKMFEDPEFEIDEKSQEYRALHPVASQKQSAFIEEHFDPVMELSDEGLSNSDASASEDDGTDNEGRARKKSRAPRLLEVKDERHADAFWSGVSLANEDALPLEERVAKLENDKLRQQNNLRSGPGGSREISFVSRSQAKYEEDEQDREPGHGKKRGVQSLGLRPHPSDHGGRGRGRGGGRGRGRGGRRGGGRGRGGFRGGRR